MALGHRSVGTIPVALGTLVALTCAPACEMRGPSGRVDSIALRATLTPVTGARQSWSFTVNHSGAHDISLEFPWPIEDKEAADLVQRATESVGTTATVPAEFDFSWEILEDTKQLAHGSGDGGVRGIVDSSDSGLGGGPLKSRALVVGTFPAQTGVTYTLRVVPRSAFAPLLRAKPAVLIERNRSTSSQDSQGDQGDQGV